MMKVFTIKDFGIIENGASVEAFTLSSAKVTIPAILVGEEGRGRKLGVLPVGLKPDNYKEWKENGRTKITHATPGQTKSGAPKLFEVDSDADDDGRAIVVMKTAIGFRGGNQHTGDITEEKFTLWNTDHLQKKFKGFEENPLKEELTLQEFQSLPEELELEGEDKSVFPEYIYQRKVEVNPFPGEVICQGVIAQGMAGRMGCGDQIVAVMPKGAIWRIEYSGRLYGKPGERFFYYDGNQILGATLEERRIADLF